MRIRALLVLCALTAWGLLPFRQATACEAPPPSQGLIITVTQYGTQNVISCACGTTSAGIMAVNVYTQLSAGQTFAKAFSAVFAPIPQRTDPVWYQDTFNVHVDSGHQRPIYIRQLLTMPGTWDFKASLDALTAECRIVKT